MVYFFHHFELPVIIQQAQLQNMIVRNRNSVRVATVAPSWQNSRLGQRSWLMRFRLRNISNDRNNNVNHPQQSLDLGQSVQINNIHILNNLNDSTTNTNTTDDLRSNFQRNYEENNFLPSSDYEIAAVAPERDIQSQQLEGAYSVEHFQFPRLLQQNSVNDVSREETEDLERPHLNETDNSTNKSLSNMFENNTKTDSLNDQNKTVENESTMEKKQIGKDVSSCEVSSFKASSSRDQI